ncbi:MAG: ABC transporter permease subunit [Rhizobiales bacterium]|nr:ABC transporter permease subunit [Hyphomicrobiales bacterium]
MSKLGVGIAQPYVRDAFVPPTAPPVLERGFLAWARKNLFSSISNTILTLVGIYLTYALVWPIIQFGIIDAVWSGTNADCRENGHGACWPMVQAKLGQYIYGRYPGDERWRVDIVFYSGLALLIPFLIPFVPFKRLNAILLLGVYPLVAFVLLTGGNLRIGGMFGDLMGLGGVMGFVGDWSIMIAVIAGLLLAFGRVAGLAMLVPTIVVAAILAIIGLAVVVAGIDFGLEQVETALWGGLLVTLVIAITGIVASLPLGILLALGRRSDMPIIKTFCVGFIEFWRGVPLITVLFMSSVMFPLFLPEGVTVNKLLRALVGVALFSSAYMAEVVRGGLQAIPKGQYEGAQAVGLSYWQMMGLIVLPQALKHVIPGIVNSFIALFKDTTLVLIIGLFDLLGIIQLSFTDASWASTVQSHTGYLFAAIIFWAFCFSMSQYSYYIERTLHTGHKR